MSIITKILENQGAKEDKVYIHIDENFCCSIRKRTWIAMNLNIGSQITCEDLKILEDINILLLIRLQEQEHLKYMNAIIKPMPLILLIM